MTDVTPTFKTKSKRPSKRSTLRAWRQAQHWSFERDLYRCQARISLVCTNARTPGLFGLQAHHVLPRSQGGPDEPFNLVSVCWTCHAHIHANPEWSRAQGLLRRSWHGQQALDATSSEP